MSIQNVLGFKAIVFDARRATFISPQRQSFAWDSPTRCLVAKCPTCQDIPGDPCRCGIYAAREFKLAQRYAEDFNSAIVLLEACGKTILSWDSEAVGVSWRAAEAEIVAIVRWQQGEAIPQPWMAAALHYELPVLAPPVAELMVKMSWERALEAE